MTAAGQSSEVVHQISGNFFSSQNFLLEKTFFWEGGSYFLQFKNAAECVFLCRVCASKNIPKDEVDKRAVAKMLGKDPISDSEIFTFATNWIAGALKCK